MKCPQCGKELPHNSKFCQYCGSAIPKIPSHKSFIFLISILSLSIACNVYLAFQFYLTSQSYAQAQEKISSAEAIANSEKQKRREKESELLQLNKDIDKISADLDFFYDKIRFIPSGEKTYHKLDCPHIQGIYKWKAHNVEYCEALGYEPCSECHKYR